MSGWIKFEKDLQTDPRVLRIARSLTTNCVMFSGYIDPTKDPQHPCNAIEFPAVTLVCGALVRLWSLADTHVAEDDILSIPPEEIDDIIGMPGFCALLPADWLISHGDYVELPDFHKHNGTEAKKKAQVQKRVERHRKRNAPKLRAVTPPALPDQDQDQDHRSKPTAPPKGGPAPTPSKAKTPSRTAIVWEAYSAAYERRYKVKPTDNGKVRGQLSQFINRVPQEEAPKIAAFYVDSDRGLYTSSKHCVDLLLRDAEALRTEFLTGVHSTDDPRRSKGYDSGAPWWTSHTGIEAKAKELGIDPPRGISYPDLKVLCDLKMAGGRP